MATQNHRGESTLAIGASVGLWLVLGCVPALAGASARVDASLATPTSLQAPARAAVAPATWARLLTDAWASETSAYADAVDADPPAPPTAVYDIMAHVVVLPDGTRLEAHSGLREHADDPRFVAERMRGATPPALYDLEPRKRLFHGIAALRLSPVLGDVFHRTGLLAHTYMLRGRPESNGCVVFRDYAAFLSAFREGWIKRLRVVPSVGDAGMPIEMARPVEHRA